MTNIADEIKKSSPAQMRAVLKASQAFEEWVDRYSSEHGEGLISGGDLLNIALGHFVRNMQFQGNSKEQTFAIVTQLIDMSYDIDQEDLKSMFKFGPTNIVK